MRNGLNQFEREILEDTGLSIPQFAHIRNRVYCSNCRQWFRANKYLGKELAQEDKDADAWGVRIHPGIMCGRCGAKYREEAYGSRDIIHAKVPKRMSKRRWKIIVQRNRDKWEMGDD